MKLLWVSVLLISLAGCANVVDANKIKSNQKQRMSNSSNNVKEQTGLDLGTATPAPKKKLRGLLSAPVDP